MNIYTKDNEEEEDKNINIINNKQNIILFLDEINTTNSINLIVELFKNHSFLGIPLKENVYIIGSCNPYRLMLSKNDEIGYTSKRHHIRNLIYSVNPLPLSLINNIFDFGNIREEEEKKYISSFIDSFLKNHFPDFSEYERVFDIICSTVYECQDYIRNYSEISSVSLREIHRLKIFFKFFYDITEKRKEKINEFSKDKKREIKNEELIVLKAINLSLYLCYYIRIIEIKKKEDLSNKITNKLGFDFLEYPTYLEEELANNMKLSKGIAKNRALLDNIFSLFVCLNLKIPIFICGKAGCSKSLSFSLLFKSMKGKYSQNELFKNYPSLYVTSYQGSLTSKSSDIKSVFQRAKKIAQESNKEEILSIILFYEMGLSEISPNNPLKVIHSELDDNNNEIGFVGISNWSLDASKMNRGVHLSIQEPELGDLILTAERIAEGIYNNILLSNKGLIKNLTKAYYEYKSFIKQKYNEFYDFHGARDFYYLIKIVSRKILNNISSQSTEQIAMESIERNFSGLDLDNEVSSTKIFKNIFSKLEGFNENIEKYDVFSCIKNNLEDNDNRYLLFITDKTKSDTLIEFILKELNLDFRFIQGSKLNADQNEDYVIEKALSIISSMENGEIIILKDLEMMYPKFYCLFNQNFQKYGKSSYARIVLDSTSNERHIVHEKFRSIVLLEKNDIKEQDTPFLNRFEKHLISFKFLLSDKQNLISEEIFEEIKDITKIPENKNKPLLININIEEIRCLILKLSRNNVDFEKNLRKIYEYLIPTFSQENILTSIFSQSKKYINKGDIIDIYLKESHTNVFKFLERLINNNVIIYTFSPCYKDLFDDNNNIKIENNTFGLFCKNNTLEITFNEKLSENILNFYFDSYYEKNNYNLLIIHIKFDNSNFLKYIKFLLNEYHKKNKDKENKKKVFLFIIHIKKNISSECLEKYHSFFLSFISEYQQITIDNILEKHDITMEYLVKFKNESLFEVKELIDINLIVKKKFAQILNLETRKLDNLSINGMIDYIVQYIRNFVDWQENLLRKSLLSYSLLKEKDEDFISYFKENLKNYLSDIVDIIIKRLVKDGYIVSYMYEKEIPEKIAEPIKSYIDEIILSEDNLDEESIDNNKLIDLKIPGSKLLFQKLLSLIKDCKNDYINKENEYRKPIKRKNENTKTLEDVLFEKKEYLNKRIINRFFLCII